MELRRMSLYQYASCHHEVIVATNVNLHGKRVPLHFHWSSNAVISLQLLLARTRKKQPLYAKYVESYTILLFVYQRMVGKRDLKDG